MPKVSICIPAYNGSQTLRETLDNLVSQIFGDVEIILCDDRSKDDTLQIAREYESKYPFIRVFQNEQNLGMDRNFSQAVAYASGEFIWLSGQDDIFQPGAISKFFDILTHNPKIDFIYFNYQLLSGDLSREVAPPPLSLNNDMHFENSEEYFKVLKQAPSFLAATVMRRVFWINTQLEAYWGTHYVQVGVWLQNCLDKQVYVVASPQYIGCRNPEDSWKYTSGQMLFEIFSGQLEVYYKVHKAGVGTVTTDQIKRMRAEFIGGLPGFVIFFSGKGFRLNALLSRRMKYIFGDDRLLYLCYILPLIHMPNFISTLIRYLYHLEAFRLILRNVRKIAVGFGNFVSRSS